MSDEIPTHRQAATPPRAAITAVAEPDGTLRPVDPLPDPPPPPAGEGASPQGERVGGPPPESPPPVSDAPASEKPTRRVPRHDTVTQE